MANSALLLEENSIGLISEDIELSLRSLQTLLQDLKDDSEEKTKKSKKSGKKIYIDEDGIKSFFYGDDQDVYEEDDEDEEEEYPTPDHEDKEKLREAAKTAPKQERRDEDVQDFIKKINYETAETQKIASVIRHNNMNYPTDRAFESVIIENRKPTDVYHLLLDTAITHNLQIEARSYEGWGGGGMYIESVNGIKNGQDGYFWEYIVNGKIPDISADKFQSQTGDLVELRRLKKEEIKC